MAGRLKRQSAGVEVQKLIQQLSDDLLVLETKAFADLEFAFASHLGRIEKLVGSGSPVKLANDVPFLQAMSDVVLAAADDALVVALDLFDQSANTALKVVTRELEICGQTFSSKFSRAHVQAIKTIDQPGLVAAAADAYKAQIVEVAGRWIADVAQQLLLADTKDEAVERLTSTLPLNLHGNQGRGVWWRACTTMQRLVRETSINLVNTISSSGIEAMNAVLNGQ